LYYENVIFSGSLTGETEKFIIEVVVFENEI